MLSWDVKITFLSLIYFCKVNILAVIIICTSSILSQLSVWHCPDLSEAVSLGDFSCSYIPVWHLLFVSLCRRAQPVWDLPRWVRWSWDVQECQGDSQQCASVASASSVFFDPSLTVWWTVAWNVMHSFLSKLLIYFCQSVLSHQQRKQTRIITYRLGYSLKLIFIMIFQYFWGMLD